MAAFKIPTLAEVNRTVENGFSQAFYGTSGILRVMILKVVSKVMAGAVYLAVLLLSNIWKNSFVASASVDGLVNLGEKRNMPPRPASPARGKVVVTGTGGTSIPAGTIVVEEVSGNEYEFLSAANILDGSSTATAQIYSIGFGSQYDLPASTPLVFRDSAPGEFTIAVDSEGIYGGVAVDVTVDGVQKQWGESVDDYRARLARRIQNMAVGGDVTDYWEWAMSFSEVSDCFIVPNYLLTNIVCIICVDFRSPSISLNSTILGDIRNYINSQRPATSLPLVGTAEPIEVAFTCQLPVVNDFYKESVISALKSYFRKVGPGQTFSVESIRQQILGYAGVDSVTVGSLVVKGSSVAEGSYTLGFTFSGSSVDDYAISGEVVDVNYLDQGISFLVG